MAETAVVPVEESAGTARAPQGLGPFRLAVRRLRRNRWALAFGGLFVLIVLACALAPVYANNIAHTGPNNNHISEVITVDGKPKNVVSLSGIPIGPTWHAKFFLGADPSGRDVAVRVLYGGRNSLEIGVLATIITMVGAIILGVSAGFFRGWTDTIISRLLDLIWAYPALLLGVALGVSLAVGGLSIGPIHISGSSNLLPALVIGVVYIPYVARPLRGEVLSLREREFVDAARTLGYGRLKIIVSEMLPEPLLDADRVLRSAACAVDRARGEPVVPRRGRAAAQPLVGDHAGRRRRPGDQLTAPRAGPRLHARPGRAFREHLRRRPSAGL